MNQNEIIRRFPTELDAVKYFERVRWHKGRVCPYCNSNKLSNRQKDYRYRCYNCNASFFVTTKTQLHNTRLSLTTWILAFSNITDAKKGISAKQLERNLGISYESCWKMAMKVRQLMKMEVKEIDELEGIVEMDEKYVGGKPRRGSDTGERSRKKRKEIDIQLQQLKEQGITIPKGKSKPKKVAKDVKRGRGTDNIPVVGIVERGGDVVAKVMKNLTYANLKSMVEKHVDEDDSVIITDEYRGYSKLHTIITHIKIDHNKVFSYRNVNTNTIESFWAIVERGITGTYHQVSPKYLPDYVTEFVFKWNNRNKDDMFITLVRNSMKVK